MNKQFTLSVHGRVQGVGFRYAAQKEARRLGLKGWVQNQADGTVTARIQGEESSCNDFIRWCHRGSGFSWVEKVDIREEEPENLGPFGIR